MNRRLAWSRFLVGLAVTAALPIAQNPVLASADRDPSSEIRSKVKVVVVDDDGEPREKVWVFENGSGKHGFLGVRLEKASQGGALVKGVVPDSPAEHAGLLEGDVIVGVDGREVEAPEGLVKRIREAGPGDSIDLEVVRDGSRLSLPAELTQRPSTRGFAWHAGDEPFALPFDKEAFERKMEQLGEALEHLEIPDLHMEHLGLRWRRPRLGVELVETTRELREHLGGSAHAGVLVGKVLHDMPAESAGVRVGDLIVALDDTEIEHAHELVRALADRSGETVTLHLVRDGQPLSLHVVLPEEVEDDEGRPRAALESEALYREAARLAAEQARLSEETDRIAAYEMAVAAEAEELAKRAREAAVAEAEEF